MPVIHNPAQRPVTLVHASGQVSLPASGGRRPSETRVSDEVLGAVLDQPAGAVAFGPDAGGERLFVTDDEGNRLHLGEPHAFFEEDGPRAALVRQLDEARAQLAAARTRIAELSAERDALQREAVALGVDAEGARARLAELEREDGAGPAEPATDEGAAAVAAADHNDSGAGDVVDSSLPVEATTEPAPEAPARRKKTAAKKKPAQRGRRS